jgi:hypothetical protein
VQAHINPIVSQVNAFAAQALPLFVAADSTLP